MQHIEFFHREHFEYNYHRFFPGPPLSQFIDFFWETDFGHLWTLYPYGFSDALFPNTGYTYLLNLGSPFVMQVDEEKFDMKRDGFLPRHKSIECFHRPGNHLFGIKFKVSPVLLEKKVDFSDYNGYITPLSYLVDQPVIDQVKKTMLFSERVKILSDYFIGIIDRYPAFLKPVRIVTAIMEQAAANNDFTTSVEEFAQQFDISPRTLHRYFETATGASTKKILQIMRIRKATQHLANDPGTFNSSDYGYYDHSHFYKHLRQFLQKETLRNVQLHVKLLEGLHK